MTRLTRALPALSLLALAAAAFADSHAVVRGELHGAPQPVDRLTVFLVSSDHSFRPEQTPVNADGTFQFRGIETGNYVLEVHDANGEVIRQQPITVSGPALETSVFVGAANKTPDVPAGAPTVSVKQLQHDPDGRAAHEFNAGEALILRKDYPAARKHFVKALKIDPLFADAHAELGIIAFRGGQIDEARQEFERTVELDPKHAIAWGNLATMYFQSKAYDRAEQAARQGLEGAPHDPKLHFLIGSCRFARGEYAGETAAHLEEASKGYPNARIMLAESLMHTGDTARARPHLKASLASTNEAIRTRAQYLLGVLERPVKDKSAKGAGLQGCEGCAPAAAVH